MFFAKHLREGLRRGRSTCRVRIPTRPHATVGGRYRVQASLAMLTAAIVGGMTGWPLEAAQGGPERQAEAFRRELVAALARDDRRAVARMVRYRFVVDAGILIPIGNPAALYEHWNIVFPPETRCLIEGSGIAAAGVPPKYEMRAEPDRVTFGDGRIIAERGADGLKLTSMRLPPGFGSGTPRKPRQVAFRWGKGRVSYTGRLTADNVDIYVVQARAGDLLNAQLARTRADQASIRIVRDPGSQALPASAPRGADPRLLWAGRIPETGRYRIEIVRTAAYCDPPATYQLTISLD